MIRASVVLPVPGGPVEDGAVGLAGLDRDAQGRAGLEQLPLAHELVKVARAHPGRQRCLSCPHPGAPPSPSRRFRTAARSSPQYERAALG